MGSTELRRSTARIVAATNANLDGAARRGQFRRDLFARLHASNAPVELPPLRKRPEDVHSWARRFAVELDPEAPVELFSAGAAECVLLYPWPENLRELRGVVRSLLGDGTLLPVTHDGLPERLRAHRNALRCDVDEARPAIEPSREAIAAVLAETDGRMLTAAQRLGIDRRKLYRLCLRFGVDVQAFRRPSRD